MPDSPVDVFIEAARAHGRKIVPQGSHFLVSCPGPNHAHGDRNPSLHVSTGRNGGCALKCFAGCRNEEIVDRLGLQMRDLFVPDPTWRSDNADATELDVAFLGATYSYADVDGEVVYQVLRIEHLVGAKTFTQRRPVPGGWANNLEGVTRVPYRLPQLRAGIESGAVVWYVEGEKDAETLVELGLTATTVGGVNNWRPEMVEHFTGARGVRIVADRDRVGYEHARKVAAALDAAGITTRIVEAAAGKDVTDHVHAGLGLAELVEVAPEAEPPAGVACDPEIDDEPSSWEPVDLAAILDGEITTQPPTILERSDGENLLYPGRVHWVSGDPESGKSWFTYAAAVELVHEGKVVVVIDFEDTAMSAVERLRNLGLEPDAIRQHVRFISPYERLEPGQFAALERHVADAALVIVDACSEAMSLAGLDPYNNPDTVKWVDGFVKPMARSGPAVVIIDHMPKSRESGRRFMLGAGFKLAAVDGAAYTLDVITPFARGVSGRVRVTVAKDRPGHVRASSASARVAGEMALNAKSDGTLTIQLQPAGVNSAGRPTGYMERVSLWLEPLTEPAPTSSIKDGVGGKSQHVSTALELLVSERFIERLDVGRGGRAYRSLKPYRAASELPENAAPSDLIDAEREELGAAIFGA